MSLFSLSCLNVMGPSFFPFLGTFIQLGGLGTGSWTWTCARTCQLSIRVLCNITLNINTKTEPQIQIILPAESYI